MKNSIFDHINYRSVIKSWVSDRPRGEMKNLAELLGIPSSVFSQTLSGMRELTEDHAFILSQHFGFSELEKDYFLTLLQIERSSHFSYKEHLKKKLVKLKTESLKLSVRLDHEKSLSEKDQAEFYSSWLYSAIRLYCDISGGSTLDGIISEFKIEREKTLKIIQFLLQTGLIVHEGAKYKMGPSRTHVSKDSPFVSRHHTNWRIRAAERAQFLSDSELQFSGPMTLSQDDFSKLREKMVTWIQEVSDTVKDSKSEVLACFNIDFIYMK